MAETTKYKRDKSLTEYMSDLVEMRNTKLNKYNVDIDVIFEVDPRIYDASEEEIAVRDPYQFLKLALIHKLFLEGEIP